MTVVKLGSSLSIEASDVLYFDAAMVFALKPECVLAMGRIIMGVNLVLHFKVVLPIHTPGSLNLPA